MNVIILSIALVVVVCDSCFGYFRFLDGGGVIAPMENICRPMVAPWILSLLSLVGCFLGEGTDPSSSDSMARSVSGVPSFASVAVDFEEDTNLEASEAGVFEVCVEQLGEAH